MTKTERVAKAVAGHSWSSPKEWVDALGDLADLNDAQIERLARTTLGSQRRETSRGGIRARSPRTHRR